MSTSASIIRIGGVVDYLKELCNYEKLQVSGTVNGALKLNVPRRRDYERAECNCALGIEAVLDKNMDTTDDVQWH
jgi:hypothetical protein